MEAVSCRFGGSGSGAISPPSTAPPLPLNSPLLSSTRTLSPTPGERPGLRPKDVAPTKRRLGHHAGSASTPTLHSSGFERSGSRDWLRHPPLDMVAGVGDRMVTGWPGTMNSPSPGSPGLASASRCLRADGLFASSTECEASFNGGALFATSQREMEGLAAKLKRQVTNLQDRVHDVIQPLENKLSSIAGKQPVLEWQISEVWGSVRALQEEMRLHVQQWESPTLELQHRWRLEEIGPQQQQQQQQQSDCDFRCMVQSFEKRLAELEDKEQRAAHAAQQIQAAATKLNEGAAVASASPLSREEVQDMLDLFKKDLSSSVEGIRREASGCSKNSGLGIRRPPLPDTTWPLVVATSEMQLAPNEGSVTMEPTVATKLNNVEGRDPPNNQELADLALCFSQKLSELEELVNGAFANALRECGPWMLKNLRQSLQRNLQLSEEHKHSEGPHEPKAVMDPEEPSQEKAWKEDLDEFMALLRCEIEQAAGQCAREEVAAAVEPLKQDLAAADVLFVKVKEVLYEWLKSEIKGHGQCTAELIDRVTAWSKVELAQLVEKGTKLEAVLAAHDAQMLVITERVELVERVTAPHDEALLRLSERVAQADGALNPQATEVRRISQRVAAIENALAPQGGGIVRPRGAAHDRCIQQASVHQQTLEEAKTARLHQYRGDALS